jgi:hypothetical protein
MILFPIYSFSLMKQLLIFLALLSGALAHTGFHYKEGKSMELLNMLDTCLPADPRWRDLFELSGHVATTSYAEQYHFVEHLFAMVQTRGGRALLCDLVERAARAAFGPTNGIKIDLVTGRCTTIFGASSKELPTKEALVCLNRAHLLNYLQLTPVAPTEG